MNRGALFDWLTMYAEPRGVKRRVLDLLLVVADELVTNAFYNAPTDAHGHHVYADRPRSEPITLDAPLEVAVELRCDGTRFGIAVTDPFGSLTAPVVLASLRRCFERPSPRAGRGGAGLGLYLLLSSLSSVIFNIVPGRRTEVIGLIDIVGSYRESISAGKSVNLFVEPRT